MTTHLPRSLGRFSSQVTTGRRTFAEGGNGRGAWARRWRDLVASHASDLGGEGLSEAQISLCRGAATIECELEAMEARISEGQKVDIALYARLTNCLSRLLELVGMKRRGRPIDPTSELAKALEGYASTPIDDDDDGDEPLAD
jgi:hypothetical protein